MKNMPRVLRVVVAILLLAAATTHADEPTTSHSNQYDVATTRELAAGRDAPMPTSVAVCLVGMAGMVVMGSIRKRREDKRSKT